MNYRRFRPWWRWRPKSIGGGSGSVCWEQLVGMEKSNEGRDVQNTRPNTRSGYNQLMKKSGGRWRWTPCVQLDEKPKLPKVIYFTQSK
ncbi:hypothetical protein L6452_44631 [Arctium lappa]|uniref:Uncharacterized protein n=1 Tax=Arctium lappa TaxID=4217 RepID=A0ACB8XGY0_ARCLA|nr:hypothetical protein L6452_44631 [Arctium lappa]